MVGDRLSRLLGIPNSGIFDDIVANTIIVFIFFLFGLPALILISSIYLLLKDKSADANRYNRFWGIGATVVIIIIFIFLLTTLFRLR